MRYLITLFDNKSINVPDSFAERVMAGRENGVKSFRWKGELYAMADIKRISKIKEPERVFSYNEIEAPKERPITREFLKNHREMMRKRFGWPNPQQKGNNMQ